MNKKTKEYNLFPLSSRYLILFFILFFLFIIITKTISIKIILIKSNYEVTQITPPL